MNYLQKKWVLFVYIAVCIFTLVGIILYQDTVELLQLGFLPYLVIAPGMLYWAYRKTGRTGTALGLGITIFLFFLPLLAIWAGGRNSGSILGGLLPYNDATAYYTDALRMLDNQLFRSLSIRRPIFAAFLSFVFLLTGRNLQLALILLTLMNALICFMLVRSIKELWGPAAAAIATFFLFFFYRRFIGTTLSEQLGLALGMLGTAVLFSGAQKADLKIVLLGIFLLSLGMNVRPGALLLLPLLALWAGWFFRGDTRFSYPVMAFSIAAIAVGFMINWGTGVVVVDPDVASSKTGLFSNYSYTFYGIAVGGEGWTYINTDYPELIDAEDRETLVYQYAFKSILQNPFLFFKGVSRSFLDFFSPRNGAFSFIYASASTPCAMEDFFNEITTCPIKAASPENITRCQCVRSKLSPRMIDALSTLVISLLLLIPFIWGIYLCWGQSEHPWQRLLLFMVVGILLSAPLVPPRDASKMRVYAVTQPTLIVMAAIGLVDGAKVLTQKVKRFNISITLTTRSSNPINATSHVLTGILLAAAVIISPIAIRLAARSPQLPAVTCLSNSEVRHFRFNPGSSIVLVQDNRVSASWAGLQVPIQLFQRNLSDICVTSNEEATVINQLGFLQPGHVLIEPAALSSSGRAVFLVMHSSEIPEKPGHLAICGDEIDGIFYSQSAIP